MCGLAVAPPRGMKNILFFGSDEFSIKSFNSFMNRLASLDVNVDLCAKPCTKFYKTFYSSYNTLDISGKLGEVQIGKQYEFALISSFGMFIPKRILELFKHRLNVHPSLLPKYRGPSPIQATIMNDDKWSGVSIIDVHPTLIDAGDIYLQKKVAVPDKTKYNDLCDELAYLGGNMLAEVVSYIEKYEKSRVPQPPNPTLTKKLSKEDGRLDFDRMTNLQIESLFRAISHQIPITMHKDKLSIVFRDLKDCGDKVPWALNDTHPPGTVYLDKMTKSLCIKCKHGWISCDSFNMNLSPCRYDGPMVMSALQAKNFSRLFSK